MPLRRPPPQLRLQLDQGPQGPQPPAPGGAAEEGMWGCGLAGRRGNWCTAVGVPGARWDHAGFHRTHGHTRAGCRAPPQPRGRGKEAWARPMRGSSATPGSLAQNWCRWPRAAPHEAEHSLHGVQDDHVAGPGGAAERDVGSPSPCPRPVVRAVPPQPQRWPIRRQQPRRGRGQDGPLTHAVRRARRCSW